MKKIKKILILGSGALKIGEAGEFDYSGSQAIKALKEEGTKTVLVNPNIATIQTSKFLADTVYFLPINSFFVEKIIQKEKPDGILLSFGGQTALNCGIELYRRGILKRNKVEVLGTQMSAILITEDRDKFVKHLTKIGVSIPKSFACRSISQAIKRADEIGYPVMIRAGFVLGGQGSGVAKNKSQLEVICKRAFSFVQQILVEQYLHHYKEIEYEVVRDKYDNCITVCNMENMDPMGIHTGESIVVAPSQTLNNYEYQMLRNTSIKVVRSLAIVGECNIQFALNPNPRRARGDTTGQGSRQRGLRYSEGILAGALTGGKVEAGPRETEPPIEYYVIEVNARLSRSSALASKATGYPLAYVAAKLALSKNLTEIKNKVTDVTQSCFEPALDYVVVKIPRWDIEKFKGAVEAIGSSMKSVGEVMGIGRTFEEAFQKAIRMLDLDFEGVTDEKIIKNGNSYQTPTPYRIFQIAKAIKENTPVDKIYKKTGIDPWFLYRIKNIVDEEKTMISKKFTSEESLRNTSEVARWTPPRWMTRSKLLRLKQLGFSDKRISELVGLKGLEIRKLRKKWKILPSVFQIDTLAAEFPAKTNYLYLTYNGNHHDIKPSKKEGIIVLGSGPYRIGSSVEFDWTSVNTVLSLKKHKKESIIINCNPETVSTDYDISDKLYFEELTFERIADIYEFENPQGIIVSVGGQTPNSRAKALNSYGFKILGTSPKDIDRAEDRSKFSKLLDTLSINQPDWNTFTTLFSALSFSEKVGYPVLIRPSYVLSGSNMRVCHNDNEILEYIREGKLSKEYPVTVSKFVEEAKEIELDAVAQNGEIKACVISEHVENAGVHSGDATIVLPSQKIYHQTEKRIYDIAGKLAKALLITGPFNIQFLAKDNSVSVIEINLRSSRTFPFISKVTGENLIDLAVDAILNNKISRHETMNSSVIRSFAKDLPSKRDSSLTEPAPSKSNVFSQNDKMKHVAVKVSQFSFARLTGADPILHVEMASTGEVACFGEDVEEAFFKGELAVGGRITSRGIFISLGGEENKRKFLESVKLLIKLSLPIYSTEKTSQFLKQQGIKTTKLYKIHEQKSPNILEYFQKGKVDLAINLVETDFAQDERDHYTIRRAAIDYNIHLFTNRQKAELFVRAITSKNLDSLPIKSWDEYLTA